MKKQKNKKKYVWRTFAFENEWRRAVLSFPIGWLVSPLFSSHTTESSSFSSSSSSFILSNNDSRKTVVNFRKRGEHPLARGEESRISGVDVCVARAVEQFRCAFFFAGTRARKEREKEGRRNRAMSTTNLLTESCVLRSRVWRIFFFSHVQRPRRDARETCFREGILDSFAGWKYLTSATSFFTAKGSVSGQRVAHSKRSVRDFLD